MAELEYIVVHTLEPVEPLQMFKAWPPHITLLPWFKLNDTSEFYDGLMQVTAGQEPVQAVVGEDALFGKHGNMPVQLIEPNPDLTMLHKALLHLVNDTGRILDTSFVGRNYRPHITKNSGAVCQIGQDLVVDELTVVATGVAEAPFDRHKTVLSRFVLGHEAAA